MDYQTISMKLNKKKNIGRVIYVVEGEKKEITVLNKIFRDILNYSVVNFSRRQKEPLLFQSEENAHSQVFVINTQSSNIDSVSNGKDYLDGIYEELFTEYNLDPNDAAIYYVFDRDPKSNKESTVLDLMKTLGNSRDNDYESNGLLLLNYPSFESFIVSCFKKDSYKLKLSSKLIKKYLGEHDVQQNNIVDASLVHASNEMLEAIKHIGHIIVTDQDLDNFSEINIKVYHEQEKNKHEDTYTLLSLFLISLIDLGLIELNE